MGPGSQPIPTPPTTAKAIGPKGFSQSFSLSLPSHFISQTFVHNIHGDDFVYTPNNPLTICSGLDNTCYVRDQVIFIGMIFVTKTLLIKMVFLRVAGRRRALFLVWNLSVPHTGWIFSSFSQNSIL